MNSKTFREEAVVPSKIEERSVPNGTFACIVCGMRYEAANHADICCKKIAGIENLGGRRQHRWR